MRSVNITITFDEIVENNFGDACDEAPYKVSAWFIDKYDGTMLIADRDGINPVNLIGEVLADLDRQLATAVEEHDGQS